MVILLDMLRDCPQLRSLDIKRCEFLAYPSEETLQVLLPHLGDLSLSFNVNFREPILAPKLNRLLKHIQAPPHCTLQIDLANARDTKEVITVSFAWLLARHSKAVLKGMETLELRFGHSVSEPPGPFDFSFSGSTSIKGRFRFGGPKDYSQVVACIVKAIAHSVAPIISTSLNLGPFIAELLSNDEFADRLSELPPITHLELEQEFGYIEANPVFQIFRGMDPNNSSSFSAIRNLTIRDTSPNIVKGLVQAALDPPLTSQDITFETYGRTLERVKIYTRVSWFAEMEILVEALREDFRIAQVDLCVTL
ncbi:hypothetical protein FRB90_012835 [Tulasnella sp. 427]|nr:hypothetical protein FRB90_012835 [Tulasnella sp. 427]